MNAPSPTAEHDPPPNPIPADRDRATLASLAGPLAAALTAAIADALDRPRRLMVRRNEAAAMVGVKLTTRDTWDAAGKTPAAVKVNGGAKLYRVADLTKWAALGCPDRREFEARTAEDGERTRRRGTRNGRPR